MDFFHLHSFQKKEKKTSLPFSFCFPYINDKIICELFLTAFSGNIKLSVATNIKCFDY